MHSVVTSKHERYYHQICLTPQIVSFMCCMVFVISIALNFGPAWLELFHLNRPEDQYLNHLNMLVCGLTSHETVNPLWGNPPIWEYLVYSVLCCNLCFSTGHMNGWKRLLPLIFFDSYRYCGTTPTLTALQVYMYVFFSDLCSCLFQHLSLWDLFCGQSHLHLNDSQILFHFWTDKQWFMLLNISTIYISTLVVCKWCIPL